MIKNISITNYKLFESFALECNDGLNLIVGDNEAGKSTILEAISLALTKKLNGRFIESELSPYLFNKKCVAAYLADIAAGKRPQPPKVLIELYLVDDPQLQTLRGTNNAAGSDSIGVKLEIAFDEEYRPEYEKLLDTLNVKVIPVEYFKASWHSFANNAITARSLQLKLSYIDATTIRLQSGTDHYLHTIINDGLDLKERVGLAMAYRNLKERFSEEPAIKEINKKISARGDAITDKDLAVSIDLSQKGTWETSLTPHLNDIPFQHIGKGDQSALKIMLALDRKAEETHVVLIEEPENHLSFSTMNILIDRIATSCEGKQIFATTHSAYVLNKLGIDKVVLLHNKKAMFLRNLPPETQAYFKKLSGYDTLRLILADRTILVEGPSDELIVQKAYLLKHGKLPIQAGVDVINVRGLSFARFLDIAKELGAHTAVVTDNDGDFATNVTARYAPYKPFAAHITICADPDDSRATLEDHILGCNDRALLNTIFSTKHTDDTTLLRYMKSNKTDWALKFFETDIAVEIPSYVLDAVA